MTAMMARLRTLWILLVLFLPYGLVGTWRQQMARFGPAGWKALLKRYRQT